MKNIKQISILSAILAATLLLSACVGGGAAAATSWPGFQTDAENQVVYLAHSTQVYAIDLANPTASGDPKDPTPKFQQKWRFPADPNNKITFYAAPVLTEDGQLLAPSYDHSLYSLNPQTGLQNWVFDGSKNKLLTSPLVSNGIIYLPSSDSKLYALDLKGTLLWQWPHETDNPDDTNQAALWATPVTDGKVVYQPSMDHHVYALDAKTGNLIWKSDDLAGPIAGQPTLSPDGVLFVTTFNSQLLAINAETGKKLWEQPIQGWGWSGPLLQDGSLYFGDLKGYIYGKSASDGSDLWAPNQPPAQEGQNTDLRAIPLPPLLLDGKLYFASEVGSIYTTDPQTGNPIPFFTLAKSKLYTPPQPAGDLLLVAPTTTRQLLVGLNGNGQIVAEFVPPK